VRSFECDVTATCCGGRWSRTSTARDLLSSPTRAQPAETRRRQFTRTPYTSVILKISTSLSDTPTDADQKRQPDQHVQTSPVHPAAVGASVVVSGACRRWLPCPVRVRVGHRLGGPGCRGHIELAASPAVG
jgi:hypothetical protein